MLKKTLIKAKVGRPSTTASKIKLAKNQLNCTCQKLGGTLHLVQTKNARNFLMEVSEKYADKSLYHRLDSICSAIDAITKDIWYHYQCHSSAKQNVFYEPQHIQNYSQAIPDISFIHFIESPVLSSNNILDMNSANAIYMLSFGMRE